MRGCSVGVKAHCLALNWGLWHRHIERAYHEARSFHQTKGTSVFVIGHSNSGSQDWTASFMRPYGAI